MRALDRLVTHNVNPLVVGWFGVINGGLDKLLTKLARVTLNGPEAESLLPLENLDRNGGAFSIVLQQI